MIKQAEWQVLRWRDANSGKLAGKVGRATRGGGQPTKGVAARLDPEGKCPPPRRHWSKTLPPSHQDTRRCAENERKSWDGAGAAEAAPKQLLIGPPFVRGSNQKNME